MTKFSTEQLLIFQPFVLEHRRGGGQQQRLQQQQRRQQELGAQEAGQGDPGVDLIKLYFSSKLFQRTKKVFST